MKGTNKMTDEQMEDYIELIALSQSEFDYDVVYDVIYLVTAIYGYNEQTLDDVNYYLTGYRDYEQLKEYSQY